MSAHPFLIDASSPGPKVCASCGREADEDCIPYEPGTCWGDCDVEDNDG